MMPKMKSFLYLIIILVISGVGLSSCAVMLNKVPVFDPPGWKTRLKIYLSTNSAEMGPNNPLPELRPPRYPVSVAQLFDSAREAAIELDWDIVTIDHAQMSLDVIISTPLLGFKDDMKIRAKEAENGESSLHASSRSRTGRADFGANLGHILRLKDMLRRKVQPR